jgi:hypothetical protein
MMTRSATYLKMTGKKVARKGKKIFPLVALLVLLVLFLAGSEYSIESSNDPEIYKQPRLNSTSIGNIYFRPNSMENVPLSHTGYMHQNGPLIIDRTITRSPNTVNIVFDKSLKRHFPKFPKCDLMCDFQFGDNHNEIAKYADSFVTDIRVGIINDAAIHFNKVVFLPISKGLLNDSFKEI